LTPHSAAQELAKLDAFLAAGLPSFPLFKVFRHNSLPVWTVVVIVVDLTMSRRFFDGIGVVDRYFGHHGPSFLGKKYVLVLYALAGYGKAEA
jgi:hypothetical protein